MHLVTIIIIIITGCQFLGTILSFFFNFRDFWCNRSSRSSASFLVSESLLHHFCFKYTQILFRKIDPFVNPTKSLSVCAQVYTAYHLHPTIQRMKSMSSITLIIWVWMLFRRYYFSAYVVNQFLSALSKAWIIKFDRDQFVRTHDRLCIILLEIISILLVSVNIFCN